MTMPPTKEIALGKDGKSCPCGPCMTRRWVYAWANQETEVVPPLNDMRWFLRTALPPIRGEE